MACGLLRLTFALLAARVLVSAGVLLTTFFSQVRGINVYQINKCLLINTGESLGKRNRVVFNRMS